MNCAVRNGRTAGWIVTDGGRASAINLHLENIEGAGAFISGAGVAELSRSRVKPDCRPRRTGHRIGGARARGCDLSHCAGPAVSIDGSSQARLIDCHLHDLQADGVRVASSAPFATSWWTPLRPERADRDEDDDGSNLGDPGPAGGVSLLRCEVSRTGANGLVIGGSAQVLVDQTTFDSAVGAGVVAGQDSRVALLATKVTKSGTALATRDQAEVRCDTSAVFRVGRERNLRRRNQPGPDDDDCVAPVGVQLGPPHRRCSRRLGRVHHHRHSRVRGAGVGPLDAADAGRRDRQRQARWGAGRRRGRRVVEVNADRLVWDRDSDRYAAPAADRGLRLEEIVETGIEVASGAAPLIRDCRISSCALLVFPRRRAAPTAGQLHGVERWRQRAGRLDRRLADRAGPDRDEVQEERGLPRPGRRGTLEDCDLSATEYPALFVAAGADTVLRRCHVHNVEEDLSQAAGAAAVFEDCWTTECRYVDDAEGDDVHAGCPGASAGGGRRTAGGGAAGPGLSGSDAGGGRGGVT